MSGPQQSAPVSTFIVQFLLNCWISTFPATTAGYVFFYFFDPARAYALTCDLVYPTILVLIGLLLMYAALLAGAWAFSAVCVFRLTSGKPIPEGTFPKDINDPRFKNFTNRHLVKAFSMWLFAKHAPRRLYNRYVGSFIKLGKNVKLPKWGAMEEAEVGDGTVFAEETVFSSHVVLKDKVFFKKPTIGRNCIIDANDNDSVVCLLPGCVLEDNVVVKPGTLVAINQVLKEGGIYQGKFKCERVGNVNDIPPEELARYRQSVSKKRGINSCMVDDWSRFSSKFPRFLKRFGILVGTCGSCAVIAAWLAFIVPGINYLLGFFGHVINVLLLPCLFIIAYGVHIYLPLGMFFVGIKHYAKTVPKLPAGANASIDITDPEIIENWRKMKWLKWQVIERVTESLFKDTTAFIYGKIGDNGIAFDAFIQYAKVDPDYVSIGGNTIVSFESHIYGYKLVETPELRLTFKRTVIGKGCVMGGVTVEAGAKVSDDVMLVIFTVVPDGAVLESGKVYFGDPARPQR
ncbi:MAG: hypothetical protein JW839_01195 [Candidatus Lokiarchaeota archaeon]|nr:hypothetical protein [Candidatus Lokiarchaeota archaeon]